MKNSVNASAVRRVIIRFPQVDAARIIFYPRIFELLACHFPDSPLAVAPYGFCLSFSRPNYLGDEINLVFENDVHAGSWSFAGRMNDIDHFRIHSLDANNAILLPDEHQSGDDAFKTDEAAVGAWMSDCGGSMQLSRYFETVNVAIEEWFEDTLGLPFHCLHFDAQLGIPTVRFTTRCRELPQVGDVVSTWLRPRRVGNCALTFTSCLVRGDECLVESEQVVVFVDTAQDSLKSVRIPDDIRAAFSARLEA